MRRLRPSARRHFGQTIPTVAFVSFLAALLLTMDFLRDLAGKPAAEALTYVTMPRTNRIWCAPIGRHPACPFDHEILKTG